MRPFHKRQLRQDEIEIGTQDLEVLDEAKRPNFPQPPRGLYIPDSVPHMLADSHDDEMTQIAPSRRASDLPSPPKSSFSSRTASSRPPRSFPIEEATSFRPQSSRNPATLLSSMNNAPIRSRKSGANIPSSRVSVNATASLAPLSMSTRELEPRSSVIAADRGIHRPAILWAAAFALLGISVGFGAAFIGKSEADALVIGAANMVDPVHPVARSTESSKMVAPASIAVAVPTQAEPVKMVEPVKAEPTVAAAEVVAPVKSDTKVDVKEEASLASTFVAPARVVAPVTTKVVEAKREEKKSLPAAAPPVVAKAKPVAEKVEAPHVVKHLHAHTVPAAPKASAASKKGDSAAAEAARLADEQLKAALGGS